MSEPVNRARRFQFVAVVVGFCLVSGAVLTGLAGAGVLSHNIALVSSFLDGLISLAIALSLAYVSGSVIDYNAIRLTRSRSPETLGT